MTKAITIIFIALAGVSSASTIPVTGFGTYSLDNFYDTYANVCLFNDGALMGCSNNVPIGPAPPVSLSQLTKQDVSGDIQITEFEQYGGTRWLAPGVLNLNWWAKGTFTVGATEAPEADSGFLLGLGLITAAIVKTKG